MSIGERRTNESGLWDDFVDWKRLHDHLPLRTIDEELLGKKSQDWQDFMDHPDNDDYWHIGSPEARYQVGEMTAGKYSRVNVPSLNIHGVRQRPVLRQNSIRPQVPYELGRSRATTFELQSAFLGRM
jgi:hypothetical protein